MPRKARILSSTNTYHIILRGVNKQTIFWDREDRAVFLSRLSHYKDICGYELFAFCLMDNHIHLLLRVGEEPLSKVFRRLLDSYVHWYNTKYDRCGNLFQDRYKSEAVNDGQYFLKLVHYILQNPVVAGICPTPEAYEYSSASEYILGHSGITDVGTVFGLMDRKELTKYLLKPLDEDKEKNREDHPHLVRINDKNAADIISRKLGKKRPVDREVLKENIASFLEQGISLRQLSRVTALSRTLLTRLLKEGEKAGRSVPVAFGDVS